ncbi:MAG: hypothetical protein WBZ15_16270 [Mycobacterium sp.]|uniref:hypothetical protein n=1 Tax=Mycobacterium sp. TaxID=1785 RepID=UPI003C347FFA
MARDRLIVVLCVDELAQCVVHVGRASGPPVDVYVLMIGLNGTRRAWVVVEVIEDVIERDVKGV